VSTDAGAATAAVNPDTGTATNGASTSYDKGDIEARLRNEPDFAVEQHKANQREITRLKDMEKRLETFQPLVNAVETISPGDPAAGVNQLFGLVDTGFKVTQDPGLQDLVTNYKPGSASQENGMETSDEFLTPEEKQIRELQGQVQALTQRLDNTGSQVTNTALGAHFDQFFRGDLGRSLSQEERAEAINVVKNQVMAWNKSDAGREQVNRLDADMVDLLVHNHLRQKGQLGDVYGRMSANKNGANPLPDGPGVGTLQSEPDLDPNASALDAFTIALNKFAPETVS